MIYKCNLVNRLVLQILLLFAILYLFLFNAEADVIKIKDGAELNGIIQQETDDKVVIEVRFGKITLTKEDIESIDKASKEENDLLRAKWEKEKQKDEELRQYTDEKAIAPEQVKVKPETPTTTKRPATTSKKTETVKEKPKRRPGAISIVKCDDGIHSYAACLPSNYEQKKKYPVLFSFDPGADGTEAVRKFAFAAEKYGWIVVGSLNAKNGPWDPIIQAQSAMLEDIKKRYSVDREKYYAAGFSGGARMSYTIAYQHPSNFKGVIACGAGFGEGSISKKVAVYHCIGRTDSNLDEVKKAHAKLERKHIATHLNIFSGGHSWPPDNVLKEAVDWITSH